MFRRKSNIFFIYLAVGVLLICLMFLDAAAGRHFGRKSLRERQEMVRVLKLTDLCLFTEARYTRHPSMADFNTPFQDHPLSLEHFPSGAIMAPPPHLKQRAQR
jgi:hypothetical protein